MPSPTSSPWSPGRTDRHRGIEVTGEPQRGGEFYEDPQVRGAYLAHRHSGSASPNVAMEEPHLLDVLGDLRGAQVLDLGCGDGPTAPLLLEAGATRYLGLDGSAGMIETARAQHGRPGIEFVHENIEDIGPELGSFDIVVSRMALHYVALIEPVIATIRELLRPGGRLVFSVSHPVITSHAQQGEGQRTDWIVDGYFVRGPRERTWFGNPVVWHHRTVEDYVRAALDAGMRVDELRECEPDSAALVDDPAELARRRRVPLILLVAASK
jgi:SAM-dependent methyltransferase